MHVLATAGHVDHGKSTLVRALTGMEPDRFAEERRRGMTLDLGFAWTRLDDGTRLAFVDVPGHERFVQTMLAGVGPVPAALFVVAADSGWQAQSAEHLAVLDALGVRHGLLVVTRADLADPAAVLEHAGQRLARSSLGPVPAIAVSARTGQGMPRLCALLGGLAAALPGPTTTGRVRMFVDRSFTISGAGTVVTGTLPSGSLAVGDTVEVVPGGRCVRVRGLQLLGEPVERASGVARVAVNLRGVGVSALPRGSALVSPGAWATTTSLDARLTDLDPADLPGDLMLHLGSAAVPCHLRPLGEDTCRVRLASELPLTVGDRAVVRDPSRRLVTGLVVLDVDPPALRRRGAARARAGQLEASTGLPDPVAEVRRRGATTREHLAVLGVLPADAAAPAGLREVGGSLVDPQAWRRWEERLLEVVDEQRASSPLDPGVSTEHVRRLLGLPSLALVDELVAGLGGQLVRARGRVLRPGSAPVFTEQVAAVLEVYRARLEADPLDAPTGDELDRDGLSPKILGAAARTGSFLVLPGDVVVGVRAPALAVEALFALDQPFTMSEARQSLGTTRRIAMPLLEHLDRIGLTTRLDDARRRVVPAR